MLHKALQQAVLLSYICYNPTTACVLPKIVKREIHPLADQQTAQLLNLLKGSKYEIPLTVDLVEQTWNKKPFQGKAKKP